MSEVAGVSGATECSTAATVTQPRDAADFVDSNDLATASTGDQRRGPSAEEVVDGSAATADDKPQGSAAVEGPPSSADVHEGPKDSDSDERTVQPVPDCAVVDASVTAVSAVADDRAEPSDVASAGDVATCGHDDTVERSSSSSAVHRSPPPLPSSTPAARHALPSAVAAPCVRGKHRLPPVLAPSGSGQGHSMERISPLSLVVGAHPATDPARAVSSLTGGTRLGDLGLSASGSSGPQLGPSASGSGTHPPLNLSIADKAVNMKVVSVTTQRSASDAGAASRAGMYSASPRLCFRFPINYEVKATGSINTSIFNSL